MLYFTANKLTIKPCLKHLANELHVFGCWQKFYKNTSQMNDEIKKFLEYHKIDDRDIIDANGKTINDIKSIMKQNDKLFAYNTTPCQNGHTIRDRHSHCIVCNTANIAFMKRSRETGYLYIAGSLTKQFIKVGMSTVRITDRLSRLNSRRVGNANDWVVIKTIKCDFVNRHEFAIHNLLRKYKINGNFADETESNEIFRCSYEKANDTIEKYFEENQIPKLESKTYLYNPEKYYFKNLINPLFN